ncbi:hypothetical protein H7169_03090 [Candidatus Gracilibacteria bacterium]|nr:hypothetical protein [Candidatus Gracilibacteria bacterium]
MRNLILIITSTTLCIGVGLYFLFFYSPKNWNIEYSTMANTGADTYANKKAQIEKINIQDSKIANMAIQDSNIELCTTLSTPEQQIECRDTINIAIAQKNGNIELCDGITSTGSAIECRDNIRSDRAISSHNKILCDKISNSDKKEFCQNTIDKYSYANEVQSGSLTQEFCTSLGNIYQSECMNRVVFNDESQLSEQAIVSSDMSICDRITNIELKNNCRNTINLKIAISTKTNNTCSDINVNNDRAYCESQLSKINDMTNYKSAMKNGDIDTCNKIVDTRVQSDCHDKILLSSIKTSKDISLCGSLINTKLISPCQQIAQ